MEHDKDIFIDITERLLSGEDAASLVREFPQFEADIISLARVKEGVSLKSEAPSKDSLERLLGSVRAREAVPAKSSFTVDLFVWARLAVPMLVVLVALGSYFSYFDTGRAPTQTGDDAAGGSPETAMLMSVSDTSMQAVESAPAPRMMSFKTASAPASGGRILFLGDAMFDRSLRTKGERDGYGSILAPSEDLLRSYDLLVFNLEGPITDTPSVSEGSEIGTPENYTFTFAPAVADMLARFPVAVSLGNNHTLNFGTEGIASTREYLVRAGVSFFGAPGYPGEKTRILDVAGERVALVAYNEFDGDDFPPTLTAVSAASAAGYPTVVYAHWGQEYETTPSTWMRERASAFAQAGASLIVGTHPHVVISPDSVAGVPVYYSLGNFVFDQYWEKGVRCGLALEVLVSAGQLSVFGEFPVSLRPDRTTEIGGNAGADCAN